MGYIRLTIGIFLSICILQSLNADVKAPTLDDVDALESKKITSEPKLAKKLPAKKIIVKKSKPTPKRYKLTINTIPIGAKVRITNIKPKYRAKMYLAAGTYNIQVSKAGYDMIKKKITISNKSVFPTIKLSKKAERMKKTPPVSDSKPIDAAKVVDKKKITGSQFIRKFYFLSKSDSSTVSYALLSQNAQSKLPFADYVNWWSKTIESVNITNIKKQGKDKYKVKLAYYKKDGSYQCSEDIIFLVWIEEKWFINDFLSGHCKQ
jgi:hypothetical protein